MIEMLLHKTQKAEQGWKQVSSAADSNSYVPMFVYNNFVWAHGGRANGSTDRSNLRRFNTTTMQWTASGFADNGLTRREHVACVVGTKLYVVNGVQGTTRQQTLLIYDFVANSWSTGPTPPTFSSSQTGVAIGTVVYVYGGNNPDGGSNELWAFDTVANSWSTKATGPFLSPGSGSCVLDGNMYIVGSQNSAAVAMYNPTSNTWTSRASLPTNMFRGCAGAINGKIYAFGGHSGADYINAIYEYTPGTNTWVELAQTLKPAPRAAAGYAVYGGKLYIYAGQGVGTTYLSDTWTFTP